MKSRLFSELECFSIRVLKILKTVVVSRLFEESQNNFQGRFCVSMSSNMVTSEVIHSSRL